MRMIYKWRPSATLLATWLQIQKQKWLSQKILCSFVTVEQYFMKLFWKCKHHVQVTMIYSEYRWWWTVLIHSAGNSLEAWSNFFSFFTFSFSQFIVEKECSEEHSKGINIITLFILCIRVHGLTTKLLLLVELHRWYRKRAAMCKRPLPWIISKRMARKLAFATQKRELWDFSHRLLHGPRCIQHMLHSIRMFFWEKCKRPFVFTVKRFQVGTGWRWRLGKLHIQFLLAMIQ